MSAEAYFIAVYLAGVVVFGVLFWRAAWPSEGPIVIGALALAWPVSVPLALLAAAAEIVRQGGFHDPR